ncbi:MAG: diacylglycerol kinase family lipid kinase [Acidobacteriota bacterium]|nr:diacylglycerol kinase family lipid kinase [Acidobacteriota bacterium]
MPSPIKVIMNAGSGKDEDKDETKKQLVEAFRAGNLDAHFSFAESGEELLEMAEEAASGDYQTIVAAGGDGTISAVAAAIAKTGKTLGVLPFGTLNHFSKDLNIPAELEESVRIIAENHTMEIDIGDVNGQIFINNSSIGLYPQIVRRREKQQHRLGRGKWTAAFWAAIAVMRRYPFLKIKLKIDGEEFLRKTPFIFIGNNEYEMDSFSIGGRKCLDAGNLSIYVLHRTGRMGLVRLALRSLFGKLRQAKDFETFCTDEITIETRRKKLLVAFDGEVKQMETPLHYRIRPNALRVIVPKSEEILSTDEHG